MIADDKEYNALRDLVQCEGWRVYQATLKFHFNRELPKLRGSKMRDLGYSKVCGKLDGLELALRVVDEEMEEYVALKEREQHREEIQNPA